MPTDEELARLSDAELCELLNRVTGEILARFMQFAGEDEPFAHPRMMLFRVCFAHPAIAADDCIIGAWAHSSDGDFRLQLLEDFFLGRA